MEETKQKNNDFMDIYNKAYRLSAAVFTVSRVMDQTEELGTKIKNLSLDLVSMSVSLKDVNFLNAKKLIGEIEKSALLLMSLFDIAAIAGLVSPMNGSVIKEEFQSFILELGKFTEKFEDNKNVSVKGIFLGSQTDLLNVGLSGATSLDDDNLKKTDNFSAKQYSLDGVGQTKNTNGNGYKRKDLRKNTILNFIKGHSNANIKDILPNVVGCSEKTIQRELLTLIKEGKIKKVGERRWSRYSAV